MTFSLSDDSGDETPKATPRSDDLSISFEKSSPGKIEPGVEECLEFSTKNHEIEQVNSGHSGTQSSLSNDKDTDNE